MFSESDVTFDTEDSFNEEKIVYTEAEDPSLPSRMKRTQQAFKAEIGQDAYTAMDDEGRRAALAYEYDTKAKPTREELEDRNAPMEGTLSFADKALHTITGNEKWQTLADQRDYLSQSYSQLPEEQEEAPQYDTANMNQSELDQMRRDESRRKTRNLAREQGLKTEGTEWGYEAGKISPYLAAGIGAGMIPNLTTALITDSGIQASLSFLEYARSDDALENIARDVAIDTAVNGVTFGIVRMLAKGNIAKGDLNKASNQLFGKKVDNLSVDETVKFEDVVKASKKKIIEEVETDPDFLKALDDMIEPEAKQKAQIFDEVNKLDVSPEAKTRIAKKVEANLGDDIKIAEKLSKPKTPKHITEKYSPHKTELRTVQKHIDRIAYKYSRGSATADELDLLHDLNLKKNTLKKSIVKQSKSPKHVEEKLAMNEKLYSSDEDLLKKENSKIFKSDKLDSQRRYEKASQADVDAESQHFLETAANEDYARLNNMSLKELEDEANQVFAIGSGDAVGGGLAGGTLGGTEALYEDMVEGKDLSKRDYLIRILGGAAVGAIAGKYAGNKSGIKSLVGGVDDEAISKATRNKNFNEWFKGSHHVASNAKGEPDIFYHGTMKDFDSFDMGKTGDNFKGYSMGMNFTTDPTDAKGYAQDFTIPTKNRVAYTKDEFGDGANVIPVNLSFKNPLILEAGVGDIPKYHGATSLIDNNAPMIRKQVLASRKTNSPYDAVVAIDGNGKKNVVIFNNTDIKSINNQGTFSKTDPNILKSSPTAGGAIVGSSAGIETDEKGNITFDPTKAALGAVAGATAVQVGKRVLRKIKPKQTPKKSELTKESLLKKTQRTMQDKFNRVKELQQLKAGDNLPDNMNIYQTEELLHGRTEARMKQFTDKITKPLERKIAESGYSLDELDTYLHARHAKERNAKMLKVSGKENGSGMSDIDAEKILTKYDNAKMKNLSAYVDMMNKTRLKLIRAEGLESDEFVDMIEGSYKNYVPLKRDMSDEFGSVVSNTGRGFDIKGKEFKRAKGSDRAVESPTAHSIMMFQEALVRSEKNKVGKSFLEFAEEFPDSKLYEVESLKYSPRYDKNGNIIQLDPAYKLKDNVMHVKVDGKIKQITIHDEALASAMKNLNPVQLKYGLQYAHKAVRFLAGMSTSYNPEFIISNFTRDIQTALVNVPKEARPSRVKMIKDVIPSITGIQTGKGEWGDLYTEFAKEGGKTGWMDSSDIENVASKLFENVEIAKGNKPIKKAFNNFLDSVDKINNSVENGIRLVVYKQSKEAGLTNKRAASIAKNLTVNFNRKGEMGTALNTAYMFANASIQGSVRMAKALKSSGKAQTGAVAIAGTGFGLHLYNNSVDEENYKLIPQYIKDTNYVVMNADGSGDYYKLPLPYGYNFLKTMGDIAGEIATDDAPHNPFTRAFMAAANAFSPIGVGTDPVHTMTPTLAKLPYEAVTNQNFFGGKIRPDERAYGPDNVPDSHKSFKSVNPLIKAGAEKLNELTGGTAKTEGEISVSPETMEHMMEFIAGGLGKLTSNASSSIGSKIKGEDVDPNKIPFARRFYGEITDRAPLYKARDILDRSGKNIISDRDTKEFGFYLDKALKNKAIDDKYYLKLKREMGRNQIEAKFYDEFDIQDELTRAQKVKLAERMYFFYKDKKYKYGKGTITRARKDIQKAKRGD